MGNGTLNTEPRMVAFIVSDRIVRTILSLVLGLLVLIIKLCWYFLGSQFIASHIMQCADPEEHSVRDVCGTAKWPGS